MNNKPTVHFIGDSIALHYGPYLEEELKSYLQYSHKEGEHGNLDVPSGSNGGHSGQVVAYLNEMVAKKFKSDKLVVNCGLHDIKRMAGMDSTLISLDEYKTNLSKIITLSKILAKTFVWISTTPVDDSIHSACLQDFFRKNSDVQAYNAAAETLMKINNIPVIDLYQFTTTLPKPWYCDHVHFEESIRQKQAEWIASSLLSLG